VQIKIKINGEQRIIPEIINNRIRYSSFRIHISRLEKLQGKATMQVKEATPQK
jgi:hypothetical protein